MRGRLGGGKQRRGIGDTADNGTREGGKRCERGEEGEGEGVGNCAFVMVSGIFDDLPAETTPDRLTADDSC